jgi:signal transduction histidine kinase
MRKSTSGFALCETDGSIVGLSGDHLDLKAEMGISDLAALLCHRTLPDRYRSFIDSGLRNQVLTPDEPSTPHVSFRRIEGRNGALVMVDWGPDAARQTWRSLAEIGSLAAMFIHEIRNQLGGLKLYATFLRKQLAGQSPDHNGVEIADKIIQSINVMTDYSGLLGRLGRPVKLNLEKVDARSLIESVLRDTSAQAGERGVTVNVTVTVNSDLTIDRSQLSRALGAIVSRAIASSVEGGAVEIASFQEGEWLVLSIEDSGAGSSQTRRDRPETLALLLSNGRLTEATLELAMAERVITAHGGNIEVSSRESGTGESGTRVTLRLPVRQTKQPA